MKDTSNTNAAVATQTEITVTATVHASIIHFKRGSSESIKRGESVETVTDLHNDGIMAAAREQYMNGYGYGTSAMDQTDLREVLADEIAEDEEGEIEAKIVAAVAKYGDEIPTSTGRQGFEFGDDALDEEGICRNMELSWSDTERMEVSSVSYMIDSVTGHALAERYFYAILSPSHGHLDGDENGVADDRAEGWFDAEGCEVGEDEATTHVVIEVIEA